MHQQKKKEMYTEIAQVIHKYFCLLNYQHEGSGTVVNIDGDTYYNLQSLHLEDEKFVPSRIGFYAELEEETKPEYTLYNNVWAFPYKDFEPNNNMHDQDHWGGQFECKFIETQGKVATCNYLYYNVQLTSFNYLIFTVFRELGRRVQMFNKVEDIDIDDIPVKEADYTLQGTPEMIQDFNKEVNEIIAKYKNQN